MYQDVEYWIKLKVDLCVAIFSLICLWFTRLCLFCPLFLFLKLTCVEFQVRIMPHFAYSIFYIKSQTISDVKCYFKYWSDFLAPFEGCNWSKVTWSDISFRSSPLHTFKATKDCIHYCIKKRKGTALFFFCRSIFTVTVGFPLIPLNECEATPGV
jgi:hypothetical protein